MPNDLFLDYDHVCSEQSQILVSNPALSKKQDYFKVPGHTRFSQAQQ